MLAELVVWAGVAAAPEARRLGYAKAAVSLWSRRRRCAKVWGDHEMRTRAFVQSVAESCRRRGTLWLLGGGTLADLPLAELGALYQRILVFDIALLPGARRLARRWPNVELRAADVTGMAAALNEWRPGLPLPIASAEALRDLDPVPPDCVLSVNLLSQLPLQPMAWLQKQGVPRIEAEGFGRAMLQAHLDGLAVLGCQAGLVADRTRLWRNRAGEAVLKESALLGVTLPTAIAEWTWPLAPRGEIDPELALELQVAAAHVTAAPA
ncbi:hypothetical protein [Ferrovibrio sp.]|uniref:hypothetical protein n=1 Tax=Ferrovibrio sp. TaxID=1917215 RepID=UPI00311E2126